jgi:hypothetical protein
MPLSTVITLARKVAPRALTKFPVTSPAILARVATAIARQESRLYPLAHNGYTGSNEAIGLMQMLPDTQRDVSAWLGLPYDRQKLYDPEYALLLGSAYVAYQKQRYGDWDKAIYSYYAGSYPGAARHQSDARTYVENVKRHYFSTFGSDPETDERNGVPDLPVDESSGMGGNFLVIAVVAVAIATIAWFTYQQVRLL